MRRLPNLTLKVPADSGEAFASSNNHKPPAQYSTCPPQYQLPYLSGNTSQSTTIAIQHEHDVSPLSSQNGSATTSTSQFFSKLKGISRSRSPSSLRSGSSLSAYPLSAEAPRSPTSSGYVSASSALDNRPFSNWSSESGSSSGPPPSRSGLLKRSFSPATAAFQTDSPTIYTKGQAGKAQGAPSGLQDEFDPTTFRKNRVRPRGNPEDVYYGYDDLFDDSLDEDLISPGSISEGVVTHRGHGGGWGGSWDGSESWMGETLQALNSSSHVFGGLHSSSGSSDALQSHANVAIVRPAVRQPEQTYRDHEQPQQQQQQQQQQQAVGGVDVRCDTPPQSKPPSITGLTPPSPIRALFAMPPTPPPPPEPTSAAEPAVVSPGSPGPPPDHALPAVPSRGPSRGKRSSARRSRAAPPAREKTPAPAPPAEGLGILNVPQQPTQSSALSIVSGVVHAAGTGMEGMDEGDGECNEGSEGNTDNADNAGISPQASPYRIPRKEVARAPTGYTPQMRIIDVRELDDAFTKFTTFDDTPLASPTIDTMKEVVPLGSGPAAEILGALDTMKEAIVDPGQSTQPPNPTTTTTTTTTATAGAQEEEDSEPPKPDATHLHVFRQFLKNSGPDDAFIHRFPRFDALQTQRICTHLRNDYAIEPLKGSKKAPTEEAVSRTTKILREREVADQMLTGMWALMAHRWMTFGKLIFSPAEEEMASVRKPARSPSGKQASGNVPARSVSRGDTERRRVLDLGGAPIGDWGWHCAYDYPRSKVYTVTSRPIKSPFSGADAEDVNSIQSPVSKGPKNHRHLVVSYLWRLPFPENHFDVVSARSLYTVLKVHRHASRSSVASFQELQSPLNIMDEYDLCLEECLRVLKPGGYLEFNLLDNDIINPGPLGLDLSAKFANELEANAYDPNPTRKWIKRLNKAGFGEMKRAWIFFPMAPQVKPVPPSKEDDFTPPQHQRNNSTDDIMISIEEELRRKMEAWEDLGIKKGSTELAAPVTGLLGSWTWEKWMLKTSAEAEKSSDFGLSIDTIGRVLEEGREMGSGWRTLVGWARKPLVSESYSFGMRMRADSTNSTYSNRF